VPLALGAEQPYEIAADKPTSAGYENGGHINWQLAGDSWHVATNTLQLAICVAQIVAGSWQ